MPLPRRYSSVCGVHVECIKDKSRISNFKLENIVHPTGDPKGADVGESCVEYGGEAAG